MSKPQNIACSYCWLCNCRFMLDCQIVWMSLKWAGDWFWRLMQMTASAWTIASNFLPNHKCSPMFSFRHSSTLSCHCSSRMEKIIKLWKVFRNLLAHGRRGKIDLYPFPFLTVSIFPFPPSHTSKIINHLPADKISCSVAKQLSHLVESCDEVRSNFLPLPNASGRFRASATVCQKLHACSSRDKTEKKKKKKKKNNVASRTQPTPQVPTVVCVKCVRWIHITSRGVCEHEGRCPRCVWIRGLSAKCSSPLLAVSLETGRADPGAKMHDISHGGAKGGRDSFIFCFRF